MSSNGDETGKDLERNRLLTSGEYADALSRPFQEAAEELLSSAAEPDMEIANMTRYQNQQNDEGTLSNHDGTDRGKNQMMFVVLVSIMLSWLR